MIFPDSTENEKEPNLREFTGCQPEIVDALTSEQEEYSGQLSEICLVGILSFKNTLTFRRERKSEV